MIIFFLEANMEKIFWFFFQENFCLAYQFNRLFDGQQPKKEVVNFLKSKTESLIFFVILVITKMNFFRMKIRKCFVFSIFLVLAACEVEVPMCVNNDTLNVKNAWVFVFVRNFCKICFMDFFWCFWNNWKLIWKFFDCKKSIYSKKIIVVCAPIFSAHGVFEKEKNVKINYFAFAHRTFKKILNFKIFQSNLLWWSNSSSCQLSCTL